MNFQDLTEVLSQHRRLLLRGTIDEEKQMILSTTLALLDLQGRDPIRLEIDSGGGNANAALHLGDTIQSLQSPVHGVVVGLAGSSAFNILQVCDVRIGWPNARMLFHGISSKIKWDDPNMETEIAHGKRLHERGLRDLARRSGQSLSKLRKWSRDERMFCATEALDLGFIDRIENPRPKTSV